MGLALEVVDSVSVEAYIRLLPTSSINSSSSEDFLSSYVFVPRVGAISTGLSSPYAVETLTWEVLYKVNNYAINVLCDSRHTLHSPISSPFALHPVVWIAP